MSTLPKGWVSTTVKGLAGTSGLFVDGDWVESKDQDPNGDIRLLQLADIGDGVFLDKSDRRINEEAFTRLRCTELETGDVLIARMPDPLGRACLMPSLEQRCVTVVDVAALRVDPQIADNRWVMHTVNAPQLRAEINALASGTTRKRISRGNLGGLQIPLPPESEQKCIADKLDAVLTRVDAVNAHLARIGPIIKRFRQSVLATATSGRLTEDWRNAQAGLGDADELITTLAVDHDEIGGHERGNAAEPTKEAHDLSLDQLPDGWRIGTLKNCCTPGRPICYGILKPGPELEEGVPYIRVADFPGNRLNLAGIRRTSPEIDLQFKRARLNAGDLLLSIRGSVGRLIEIPASLEGANITQDTARLSISQRLNSKYIYFALLAPDTQRRMTNAIRGVAVRGINIGDVRALQVPIPALAEQVEIVRRVESLYAFADRLEARLQTAQTTTERLTPALLAKAFRGELVPQDPNDESASELLRRLQQDAPSTSAKRGRKSAA